jgi:hypothetical protein
VQELTHVGTKNLLMGVVFLTHYQTLGLEKNCSRIFILVTNYQILVFGIKGLCHNRTLAKCGVEAQHLQSWGFGVLRDSRMLRVRQQGPKHIALGCSWCHWKDLET